MPQRSRALYQILSGNRYRNEDGNDAAALKERYKNNGRQSMPHSIRQRCRSAIERYINDGRQRCRTKVSMDAAALTSAL